MPDSSPRYPTAILLQTKRSCGFSLLELMLMIVVMATLSALLYTGMQQARRQSSQVSCVSNLKQVVVASAAFSAENGGKWPENKIDQANGNVVFIESLLPYLGPVPKYPAPNFRESPLVCPAERLPSAEGVYIVRSMGLSYGQNAYLQATATARKVGPRLAVQYPSELVLYMDFQGHYLMDSSRLSDATRMEQIRNRHGQLANAAFADGSVRAVDLERIPTHFPSRFWQGRE